MTSTSLKYNTSKVSSLGILLFFILSVSALLMYTLNHIKKSSLKQVGESIQTVLTTVKEAHDIWIHQRQDDIREYASRTEIVLLTEQLISIHNRGISTIESSPLIQLRKTIKDYLQKNGDQGFFLITHDYISIASMRNSNIGNINLIHRQKPQLLDQSFQGESVFIPTIVSDVPLGNNDGVTKDSPPTMFFTTPIYSSKDNIIAVLAIRVDPSKQFTRITQLGRIGQSGETYTFDDQATLISHSRFDKQLSSLGLLSDNQESILNIRITDPGGNLIQGFRPSAKELPLTEMAKNAISGYSDVNTKGYRDYRGVMVLGAWAWRNKYNFGIATEIDANEALTPYFRMRNTLISLVAAVVLLGLFMLYLYKQLETATNRRLKQAYDGLEVRIRERTLELEVTKERLSKTNIELEKLAITDGLTGLYNRRHFDNCLKTEWRRCLRECKNLSIILFDIDFFKDYNDYYGHQMGDDCLTSISLQLSNLGIAKRAGDCIARYGGEEFVICLSDADEHYARRTAEKILNKIRELSIPHQKTRLPSIDYVTLSIGVASIKVDRHNNANTLINNADKALYKAKNQGRNRIVEFKEIN